MLRARVGGVNFLKIKSVPNLSNKINNAVLDYNPKYKTHEYTWIFHFKRLNE